MSEINKMLDAEIVDHIENISKLEKGSEAQQRYVEDLCKMYDTKAHAQNEFVKTMAQVGSVLVSGLAVAGGLVYKWIWTGRGFQFEKTGTFVSKTLSQVFNFKGFRG